LSQLVTNAGASCLLQGKTVTLKIKLVSFEVRTRAQTIAQHTNDAHQINLVASRLLRTEIDSMAPKSLELRLMGSPLLFVLINIWSSSPVLMQQFYLKNPVMTEIDS